MAASPIFVVGSPRSGTTFTAGILGSHPGLVDLGEVEPYKADIFNLKALPPKRATRRIRWILGTVRALGGVSRLGFIEQTPETAFIVREVLDAYPMARVLHVIRDGRDVVCSLLEQGWLRSGMDDDDGVGHPLGPSVRRWVEPYRASEFASATEATRAAWAWRRYVTAVRGVDSDRIAEIRYEELVGDRTRSARVLANALGLLDAPLERALAAGFDRSVGRWQRDLRADQVENVEREAGALLRELGYL